LHAQLSGVGQVLVHRGLEGVVVKRGFELAHVQADLGRVFV